MSIYYLPPNALPHLPADIHADQIGDGNLKASIRATVPATVYDAHTGGALADPGDAIGRIEDGTANSVDLKQSSTSLRPMFGRRPVTGRRNLLLGNTKTIASMVISNLTYSAGVGPNGEDKLHTFNGTVSSNIFARVSEQSGDVLNTVSFEVKADGANFFCVSVATSQAYNALYDLSTGTVHTAPSEPGHSASIESLGGGFYRVALHYSGFGTIIQVWPSTTAVLPIGTGFGATGDGVAGVLIRSRQQELGGIATAHQHVVSEFDVTEEGVETVHYASFDLLDDKLASDAITGGIAGQAFVAGAGGCYVTDLTIADGNTFEIGRLSSTLRDTWTDAPINALPAVVGEDEQVFDALLRSGNFTDEEIARLEAYYIAKGGKGLLVEGPELVTNGTFDTDLTGWTDTSPGTASAAWVAPGHLQLNALGGDRGQAAASFATEVGATYLAVAEDAGGDIWHMLLGNAIAGADLGFSGTDANDKSIVFVATATTSYVWFRTATVSGHVALIDNVSVKKLTPREEL